MQSIHPFRYVHGFRGQLGRIDRLYGIPKGNPGRALMKKMCIEQTGKSAEQTALRDQRLTHLDRLISDWHVDGRTLAYATADVRADPESPILIADTPRPVTFLHFDPSPALLLSELSRARIEGCYLREVIHQGRFEVEMTFVCLEPGWKTIDSCLFGDAMVVGARIATGCIPIGTEIALFQAAELFDGDETLTSDPALHCAIATASEYGLSPAKNVGRQFGMR